MSLQVWLPLNGNITNMGANPVTFSVISSNTTTNSSGKIGTCYGNNSNTAGGLISSGTISLGQKQSMFCWFKFTSLESSSSLGGGLVSQHRYPNNSGMGITIRYASSTTGYLSVNTGNGSSRTYNTYYGTTLLQANTWYHGGYTYDGSTIRIYVNGVCEKEQAYSGMSVPADYLTIFCWSLSGSSGSTTHGDYKLNGYLNDVRVYNHCLSLVEIKELVKGLVCHYKLDNLYYNNLPDSSGNGYNCSMAGSLSTGSNTPRYEIATTFASGGHAYVTITTTGFANTYTFSWWGKYTNYSGHMMWGFSNGNRLNLYMSSGNFYWNTGDGTNNPFSVSAATYGDGNWHHFAVTGDGTTTKLYIDGSFKANAKTYKGITGTTIYMNGWDSGTSYNFSGSLSDFRLYATCLSANDILCLYNTAARIPKNGAFLGYMMKEE